MEDKENQEEIINPNEDLLTTNMGKSKNRKKTCQCKHCGKILSQPNHLDTHIKTVHEHERNFKCDNCDKAYGDNKQLKRHFNCVMRVGNTIVICVENHFLM